MSSHQMDTSAASLKQEEPEQQLPKQEPLKQEELEESDAAQADSSSSSSKEGTSRHKHKKGLGTMKARKKPPAKFQCGDLCSKMTDYVEQVMLSEEQLDKMEEGHKLAKKALRSMQGGEAGAEWYAKQLLYTALKGRLEDVTTDSTGNVLEHLHECALKAAKKMEAEEKATKAEQ